MDRSGCLDGYRCLVAPHGAMPSQILEVSTRWIMGLSTFAMREGKQLMRPFNFRDVFFYGFGDLANDFSFVFVAYFLMIFYTDVMHISPSAVGVIFLVARFWDAFTDVFAGRFIDKRKVTDRGRFRPWMMRMAPFLVIVGILLFTKLPGSSATFTLAWAVITYFLWGFFYSMVNIPYGAMANVITGDFVQRTSLSTSRSVGAGVAGTVVSFVVPLVAFSHNRPTASGFFVLAVVFGVIALISYSLVYFNSTERLTDYGPSKANRLNLKDTWNGLRRNRPLIVLLIASLIMLIGLMLTGAMNAYLYTVYFHNTKALSIGGLSQVAVTLIVAPFSKVITKRFGKKEAASVGIFFTALVYLLLFILPITNAYEFVVISTIGGLGIGYFNVVIWAFVSDVIDYQDYLTGEREDGTIYAFYSFARKVGQALAGGLGGFALAAIGYVSTASQQTPEVALNIKRFMTLTPAVTYFIVFILIAFFYPMTKERLVELSNLISERDAGTMKSLS